MRNVWTKVLIAAGVVAAYSLSPRAAAQSYRATQLTGDTGTPSEAYGTNAYGSAVGRLPILPQAEGEYPMAFHWQSDQLVDLGFSVKFHQIYNTYRGEAFEVSDADQIVGGGWIRIQLGDETVYILNAFIFRPAVQTDLSSPYPGDAIANLGTLGAPLVGRNSAAVGINNRNMVVGWADVDTDKGITHAFLVTPSNGVYNVDANSDSINDLLVDLGTLGRADGTSSATAVNDSGQVVGYSYIATAASVDSAYHAFLINPVDSDADGNPDTWVRDVNADGRNDLMTDLGTLAGTSGNSWGRGINDSGVIVGESDTSDFRTRAFKYEGGVMTDLGALGGEYSSASRVNNLGQVVGWAEDAQGRRRAFLWQNGQMIDLNSTLVAATTITLNEARDINDSGVIVGWGTLKSNPDGDPLAFVLRPALADDDSDGTSDGDVDGTPSTVVDGTTSSTLSLLPLLPDGSLSTADPDGSGEDGEVQPTSTCGVGTLGVMPLTLACLAGMRRRQRHSR
ncbi:MAG: hypothetical protein CHACPFDD_02701 [Phycisphaerae bacterium]|nr:hypothetical protein [Phycisphaerae bacterium]